MNKTGFPQAVNQGKMYVGNVNDEKFESGDIITWENTLGTTGALQFLGWRDRMFAGETLRVTFWIKFVDGVPVRSNYFGITVYGVLYNEFVDKCKANVWYYVEREVKCGSSGDYDYVRIKFNSISHTQKIHLSMFQVDILRGNFKFKIYKLHMLNQVFSKPLLPKEYSPNYVPFCDGFWLGMGLGKDNKKRKSHHFIKILLRFLKL